MIETLEIFIGLKEKIGEWNQNFLDLSEKYLSSPWMGYVIFIVVLAIAVVFIKSNASK